MDREQEYIKAAGSEHLKRYGQFFTPEQVARFMADWACKGAKTMLDPAVGNSVFLRAAQEKNPACALTGYEVDPAVLEHFGNPAGADLHREDYLRGDWQGRYDAILCNPPYNRFQAVEDREKVLEEVRVHTGVQCSGLSNLSTLFFVKSMCQLSERGRLAYLVPSEFLNSRYGTPVKMRMMEGKLLRAIVNLKCEKELFPGAITTACILLLDREEKRSVDFYRVSVLEELTELQRLTPACSVPYEALRAEDKWRPYLLGEKRREEGKLVPLSRFCTVSRGIATGANEFYCFSRSRMKKYGLKENCFTPCICRSAQVKEPVFTLENFRALAEQDQLTYLLDVREIKDKALERYVAEGEKQGIPTRYLPAHRTPWYSVERKAAAPIWVCSACRNGMKFVRNQAGVANLSTFHGIYMKKTHEREADLLFAYLLTPTAQRLLEEERKELGGGLHKFQPNDLNGARMLDLDTITEGDRTAMLDLCKQIEEHFSTDLIEKVDHIVKKYLNL